MPLITPDFSETSKPVPPGVYSARIVDAEMRQSKAGNDYINWKLELFGSPDINNRVCFMSTPIKGPGAFRLQHLFEAATGTKVDTHSPSFNTDALMAKNVTVTLVERKDQEGNTSAFPDVKLVAPYRG